LSAIEGAGSGDCEEGIRLPLVIEKSTVPVQTGVQLRKHLSVHSNRGLDYDVASNPALVRSLLDEGAR
jgi:UDP-glucose 6-dehydrogenase